MSKIMQVFDFFSPVGGGTVTLITPLSKALVNKGHEVTIYTGDYKKDLNYINSIKNINFKLFHCWLNVGGFFIMPAMIADVKKNLKKYDVIHLHVHRSFQNMIIHHYAVKYNIPYIMDTHGSTPRGSGYKAYLKQLYDIVIGNNLLKDASKLIAETELGVNEYKEYGMKDDKIVLITPPFPIEDFTDLPEKGSFRTKFSIKEKHIVLFLGRINYIKGIDYLVESFYELAKERKDTLLVIVGPDDGFKQALDELIDRLDIKDRVLFTGFMSGKDKLSALVDADVLVQTSRYEQGAWAPFEAILCNTPIIVSSNSGAGEDVKRINAGYLVEWGDKTGLKNMILHVFENTTEAKEITSKAREYIVNNLSMSKNVEKYEEVYRYCINHRSAQS